MQTIVQQESIERAIKKLTQRSSNFAVNSDLLEDCRKTQPVLLNLAHHLLAEFTKSYPTHTINEDMLDFMFCLILMSFEEQDMVLRPLLQETIESHQYMVDVGLFGKMVNRNITEEEEMQFRLIIQSQPYLFDFILEECLGDIPKIITDMDQRSRHQLYILLSMVIYYCNISIGAVVVTEA